VQVRSWQDAYRGLVPQDYLDGLDPEERRRTWEGWLAIDDWPRTGVLVAEDTAAEDTAAEDDGTAAEDTAAEDDGTVVGFAAVGRSRDDDADASVGEVRAIYTVCDVWGTGVGRRLMAASLTTLATAGYAVATLWVLDTNERARRFYAAAGWRPDDALKEDRTRGFPLTELRYRRRLP
jgi:GNAT superfamily N-acetyltransferase